MRTVAILVSHKTLYQPELQVYESYFKKNGFEVIFVNDAKDFPTLDYDIELQTMGIDRVPHKKGVIKIHDYTSLSTPPYPRLRNFIKKCINKKPHIRIFLNKSVKNEMNFNDGVPFCYRDVGVNEIFLNEPKAEKKYDFCYLGSMSKVRKLENLLQNFTEKLNNSNIILIGEAPAYLREAFEKYPNIIFAGRTNYENIPAVLNQCKYGINHIPNEYPFNLQTSVKIMEYCACNLKVISTDYEWVRNFEKENNTSFFYLNEDFSNFSIKNIEAFNFKNPPSMQDFTWDNMINKSGLLTKINEIFDKL